jgi:hypothetical protein
MGFKLTSLSINLPFGLGGANIVVTEAQVRAAWALYVELATRIASQKLESEQGSIREALNSLYDLFDITRAVLKEQGPGVAEGPESVGPIAINILNKGLRPFLVEWHTKLNAFEAEQILAQQNKMSGHVKVVIDESKWELAPHFYEALEENRQAMLKYVDILATIAGIK